MEKSLIEVEVDRKKAAVAVLVTFVAVVFLFASLEGQTAESNSEEVFNRADVMFMNMMIVHHDQAIEMAELSTNRTDNENILELSKNISDVQKAENRQMAEWLRKLGYQRPTEGHRMAGMASREQMQELRNSEGREFDRLFAELMIMHHRGGIGMAKSFSQSGRNSELIEMEINMIEAQQDEIRMMQSWRQSWNREKK